MKQANVKLSYWVAALGLVSVAGAVVLGGVFPSVQPLVMSAIAQERVQPPSREAMQYSFAPIVRVATPAVVNVYVSSRVKTFVSPLARDPFFKRFFRGLPGFGAPSERMQKSLGSGVIVSADGLILTNTHVIKQRGKISIKIALADKREFDAKVILQDKKSDITVLKIDGGDEVFPYLEFADSDKLQVGDLVLAIGNPFGVGQTVTSGIVSALARSQIRSDAIFIQTDAAINPGNSGGALVDMSGRLVGINTAIFSRSGGSNGIGFAIPSNLAKLHTKSAVEGSKFERPWLGAKLENVTRDIVDALGLARVSGALVSHVYDDGPAQDAGLELRDVIVNVDGFDVTDARGVVYRLTTKGVGNDSVLTVVRGGQRKQITVKLLTAPEPGRDDIRNLTGNHPFDGARVANIGPVLAEEHNVPEMEGVIVLSVASGGVASQLGFRPGDVILVVAGSPIIEISDLDEALARPRRSWRISIRRRGRKISFRVPG